MPSYNHDVDLPLYKRVLLELAEKEMLVKLQDDRGKQWAKCLDQRVGLSEDVKEIARVQGNHRNARKPIGLFANHDDLLAEQDDDFAKETELVLSDRRIGPADLTLEKKRAVLIESFYHYTFEEGGCPTLSLEQFIEVAAQILSESELPLPEWVDEDAPVEIKQYVYDVYNWLEADDKRIHKIETLVRWFERNRR